MCIRCEEQDAGGMSIILYGDHMNMQKKQVKEISFLPT